MAEIQNKNNTSNVTSKYLKHMSSQYTPQIHTNFAEKIALVRKNL